MPIHIAITRRARPGCEAEFQVALREFFQASFGHGGVRGAMVALLTWVVMPPAARALRGWLHPDERGPSA
jgi:antibiotic biosynthesis monooxygenase (ABM) superfamily enzyme